MKDFFEGIQAFFEGFAFAPLDYLRDLELNSWFLANLINWLFILVAFAAFAYWMLQLRKFNESEEENRDPSAHSFLG